MIREAAIASRQELIGKQCTSVALPRDFRVAPTMEYHSTEIVMSIRGVSFVVSQPEGEFILADSGLQIDDMGSPMPLVPRVRRNRACPCGSGKKYKLCHGRG